MRIEQRLAKLEQHARLSAGADRQPGVSEKTLRQVRCVAAMVETPAELAAHLATLEEASPDDVALLNDRRRSHAVREAFARTVFEEARA